MKRLCSLSKVRLDPVRANWVVILFSLSAANFNFLPISRELIFFDDFSAYSIASPRAFDYLAHLILVVFLAAVIFGLMKVICKLSDVTQIVFFLGLLGLLSISPLNFLRRVLFIDFNQTAAFLNQYGFVLTVVVIIAIVGIFFLGANRAWVVAALFWFVVISSPFALSSLGQTVWYVFFPPILEFNGVAVPGLTADQGAGMQKRPRVVWLTFDGLDERVLFSRRPTGLQFRQFDLLRSQALFVPRPKPLGDSTFLSMTTAWTGERVKWVQPINGYRHGFSFFKDGREPMEIADYAHLFSKAMKAGRSTALVGFSLPYCRLFSKYLRTCKTYQVYSPRFETPVSLASALAAQVMALSPLSTRYAHMNTFRESMKSAANMVADEANDFVFIHSPVPHGPWIFDAAAKEFSQWHGSYVGNLELAERYLAAVMGEMSKSGALRESVLIVTSDHGLMEPIPGFENAGNVVPLLIKFPGQTKPLELKSEFDLKRLNSFVLELFAGRLSTPTDFLCWAENNRPCANEG